MPASNARPKQRTLIRWNDDLDKSLLLFITHTCTELGIKIPYDEIGRRMGSNFSEGAIVQHIAKLRAKMADLNVAPVPAPPKRGQIASRPSTVYTTKARAGPAPMQPATTTKGRGRRVQPDKPTGVAKARATRRRNSGNIKRSDSDVDEEEDDEMEDNGEPPNTRSGIARKPNSRSILDSGISNVHPGTQPFNFPNYSFPQDQHAFPYNSIEQDQSHSPYSYGDFGNYALQEGSAGDEEEEMEEDDALPLMARNIALHGQTYQYPLHAQSSDSTSPKSRTQMSLPNYSTSLSQFSGDEGSSFSFGTNLHQQTPQSRAYSSSTFPNYDYTTFNGNSGSNSSSLYTTPLSALPSAVPSNLPGPAASQASSRNDSLISQNGPYGTPNTPKTPVQTERSPTINLNNSSSPPAQQDTSFSTQNDLLNQSIATMSEVQPAKMDWDFPNFNDHTYQFPNYSHGQTGLLENNGYDQEAAEAFFKTINSASYDHMDFSGSSQ